MPSVTRSQQRFFGQVYSIKTGQIKPSDLDPKYRDQILKAAKDMSLEEIKKFAKTKHKGLADHLEEADSGLPVVTSSEIPQFNPKGPGKIFPFLDPDAKQKKKGQKNLQNLKDYRDWISSR
jgi:hypothetical protein